MQMIHSALESFPVWGMALGLAVLGAHLLSRAGERRSGRCPHGVDIVNAEKDCGKCRQRAADEMNGAEHNRMMFEFLDKAQEKHWDFVKQILDRLAQEREASHHELLRHRREREKEMQDYWAAKVQDEEHRKREEQERRELEHMRDLQKIQDSMAEGDE